MMPIFWGAELKNRPQQDGIDYFLGASFNSGTGVNLHFPDSIRTSNKGLPEGAKWVPAPSNDQHRKGPTDEQSEPDEVPPADRLPQNEGGEEDGDQDAQLVDGDDHALAGPTGAPSSSRVTRHTSRARL